MNMYKIPLSAFVIILSTNVASSENAASESNIQDTNARVAIEWIDPQKFRDVRHPTMSRARYRESVFAELEEYFNSLAEKLPDGQQLKLKVTDLDMAGTVQSPSMAGLGNSSFDSRYSTNDYRIVRQIDIPRMDFSFELVDKMGQVLKKEDVNLKDMSFMSRASLFTKNASLRYEKAMISRWFETTFLRDS